MDFDQKDKDKILEKDRKTHVDPYKKKAEVGVIYPNPAF